MDTIRTLIVDDEMVSREKLRLILSRHGECECAQSGADAVQAFIRAWTAWTPFDLITLDIGLPDKSGTEVVKDIRNLEEQHKVPPHHRARIMMVSSSAERDIVQQSVLAGCNDYIVKPVNASILGQKIESMRAR